MSYQNKNSYTFIKSINFFSSSTSKYYLPISNTSTEKITIDDDDSTVLPNNSGRITGIVLYSDASPGSTVLTIEDRVAGVLGTKTFTFSGSGALNAIDFNSELDSGINAFDGVGGVGIGLNVTSTADDVQAVVTFEIDL